MESNTRRRPRLQFSLRESLIATVAVCAVVAVFVKNRPYSPTAFVSGFDARMHLTHCCADLGLPLDIGGMGQGTGTDGMGGHVCEGSLMVRKPDTRAFRAVVMPSLLSRIEQELVDMGCTIYSRSQGGNENFQELHEFSFRYGCGIARGVVRVYSLEMPSRETRLLILIDES